MNSRLLTVDRLILLGPEGATLGRNPSNTLQIDDQRISGRHCRIEWDGEAFLLIDDSSANGTYVNGMETRGTRLRHGDEIRLGMTLVRFMVGESSEPCEIEMQEDEMRAVLSSETIRGDLEPPLFMHELGSEDTEQAQRANEDLRALLSFNTDINGIDNDERLQKTMLERIFDVTPAETGAVLLSNAAGTELIPRGVTHHRVAGAVRMGVSRTITQRVLTSGQSILRNDLFGDSSASPSVVASAIQSVLCVPLTVMGSQIGVVYLDTANVNAPFHERHLDLVTAMASMTAVALEHLRYVDWLESQNRHLTHELDIRHEMVGSSAPMKELYEKIARIAPGNTSVLILGERGTGKELTASAIHRNSSRSRGRLIVVNCGAIPESLFASELFGHVKGAFTGADRDRKGLVEEADGGTLFLDEIGDLPFHCQAALLRVLENREVLPVGGSKSRAIDVRVVSATNRSLEDEIAAGRFRADLYDRLGVKLKLPPLRERIEDIDALVSFFLQRYQTDTQRKLLETPPNTLRILKEYGWPGNVRQLGLAVQWAVVFGNSDRIQPEDLPPEILSSATKPVVAATASLSEMRGSHERQWILNALKRSSGNVGRAAAALGRAPTYLHRRVSQLGLRDELEEIRKGK